jgi:hypothetical protein
MLDRASVDSAEAMLQSSRYANAQRDVDEKFHSIFANKNSGLKLFKNTLDHQTAQSSKNIPSPLVATLPHLDV